MIYLMTILSTIVQFKFMFCIVMCTTMFVCNSGVTTCEWNMRRLQNWTYRQYRDFSSAKPGKIAKEIAVTRVELPREKPVMDRFLQKYFFHDMTAEKAFGLEESAPPPTLAKPSLAVKAEVGGELVGVTYCTTAPTPLWNSDQSPRHRQLVDFFTFVEQDSKMHELPGRPIELWMTGIHSDWRNHGIATRLVKEVCRLAPGLGYTALTALCTGEYAVAMGRHLGWRQLYQLAYADYPKLSGRQVFVKPTPPDTHVYLYVKDL